MDILFACMGMSDPYTEDINGDRIPGPTLTLLEERQFDRIILLWAREPVVNKLAASLKKALKETAPSVAVEFYPFEAEDPADFSMVLTEMRLTCRKVLEEYDSGEHSYWVQAASGTPQMQWAWISLVISGVLPARLIAIKPRYISSVQRPYSYEIDQSLLAEYVSKDSKRMRMELDDARREIAELKARLKSQQYTGGLKRPEVGSLPEEFIISEYLYSEKIRLYAAALKLFPNNASKAARLLGVTPHAFRKEAEKMGLRKRKT